MRQGKIVTARNRVPCWVPEGEKRGIADLLDGRGTLFSRCTVGKYEIDSFYCPRCKKILIDADLKLERAKNAKGDFMSEQMMQKERDVMAKVAEPQTVESLLRDLAALGIAQGDTLLVHCSLSSLGWVCGGAQAVNLALRQAVGAQGTLVMPAQTNENSDPAEWEAPPVPKEWVETIRQNMPGFDPASSPSRGMGRVAELFRTLPGSLRSGHPQVSFAANGPLAEEITASHPLSPQFGVESPLGALYRLGKAGKPVKILLLGVGYGNCTAFHLAETLWGEGETARIGAAVLENGERRWVWFTDLEPDADDFPALGAAYEASPAPAVKTGKIGAAECRLAEFVPAVDFAREWFLANRRETKR